MDVITGKIFKIQYLEHLSYYYLWYKLASEAIPEKLKTVLDLIISKSQSGLVPSSNISNCTRLIYDIMQTAEIKVSRQGNANRFWTGIWFNILEISW